MKKNCSIKCMTAGAVAILLCVLAVMPAYAMTPIEPWYADPVFGVYPAGGATELTVQSLSVSVQAPEIPIYERNNYRNFREFTSSLRQEYVLCNSTSKTVKQQLYLPLATLPDYASGENSEWMLKNVLETYKIEVDGAQVTPELRFVYRSGLDTYRIQEYHSDTTELHKTVYKMIGQLGEREARFDPDTPVTVYTFVLSGLPNSGSRSYTVKLTLDKDTRETLVYAQKINDGEVCAEFESGKQTVKMEGSTYENGQVQFFVIGKDAVEFSDWRLSNGKAMQADPIPAETTTLGELFASKKPENLSISDEDWFYCVLDYFFDCEIEQTGVVDDRYYLGWEIWENVQPFYSFEVEVPAQSTLSVAVESAAYPDLWDHLNPDVAVWKYCLPDSGAWGEIGQIDVAVTTDLYMIERGTYHTDPVDAYTKTDDGFAMQLDPGQQSWRFTLCTEQKTRDTGSFWLLMIFVLMLLIAPLAYAVSPPAIVVASAIIIPKLIRRRRRKRKLKKQTEQEKNEHNEQKEDDANDAQ